MKNSYVTSIVTGARNVVYSKRTIKSLTFLQIISLNINLMINCPNFNKYAHTLI
ncbi:hypothetical protein HanXRQr2_Chr05g0211391 [Helianthus annuus]|uniref:Uncharacterized protein n=1 Tax=Helianthus annuus TaxID=4232 RepID=A0A9K3NME1_HELAN|nr:hypothetical protein HanXRQr2_Chr05g0211391 [Helianthus annuus]